MCIVTYYNIMIYILTLETEMSTILSSEFRCGNEKIFYLPCFK